MRLSCLSVIVLAALAGLLGSAASAAAQGQSRCADCHVANRNTAPDPAHFDEWERSPHGRNGVGCDSCHGGDPTTFESMLAHRDILSWNNPASPVHRANLPQTCGTCHAGPYTQFQQSQHFKLLNEGDRRVPTCSTCHGTVGAHLLSPRGLERQCNACHGEDGVAPRPGRAADVRVMLEGVRDVRESLQVAQRMIDRVNDTDRRIRLQAAYTQAEVPIIQAAQSGHQFVFDRLRERLGTARERTAALLAELANPGQ